MIELDLEKLRLELVWQLEVLAAIRCMCSRHGMDLTWCTLKEDAVAGLLKTVRRIIKVRGDVMQIREKG
ncbi:hypothetical protein ES703_91917 [subsurface metagenome]